MTASEAKPMATKERVAGSGVAVNGLSPYKSVSRVKESTALVDLMVMEVKLVLDTNPMNSPVAVFGGGNDKNLLNTESPRLMVAVNASSLEADVFTSIAKAVMPLLKVNVAVSVAWK